jgi:hypothetical protein
MQFLRICLFLTRRLLCPHRRGHVVALGVRSGLRGRDNRNADAGEEERGEGVSGAVHGRSPYGAFDRLYRIINCHQNYRPGELKFRGMFAPRENIVSLSGTLTVGQLGMLQLPLEKM